MVAACRAACGMVHLVGAGPGDPELLTLRAARLLAQADVVVYDHLVGPEVLGADRRAMSNASTSARSAATTAWRRPTSTTLLVRLAREGKQVVRLKGGDPFVFGRGGEELQVLAADGVPFEVVPGITAACGVASYAGIPLTHRDYAQSCTFVTGHLKDGSCDLDWPALARPRQTVVIYMGLSGLATICAQLIAHGLPPHWPAAVVAQGTLSVAARGLRHARNAGRRGGARRAAVALPDDRRRGRAAARRTGLVRRAAGRRIRSRRVRHRPGLNHDTHESLVLGPRLLRPRRHGQHVGTGPDAARGDVGTVGAGDVQRLECRCRPDRQAGRIRLDEERCRARLQDHADLPRGLPEERAHRVADRAEGQQSAGASMAVPPAATSSTAAPTT